MIYGAERWNDRTGYYSQKNNAIEQLLKAAGVKGWYETCGPTSAVRCIDAIGEGHRLVTQTITKWEPQPEDVLTLYLNDGRNKVKFQRVRDNFDTEAFPENRIPQYYPLAVMDIFGVQCHYDTLIPDDVVKKIINGHAVQLLKPGHFVAGVAYDTDTKEIIYDDPLDGFNLRASLQDVWKWNRAVIVY